MSVPINLSTWEIFSASHAGLMRQVENLSLKRAPAHGAGDESDFQMHIDGCLGECALAKYLDKYWGGKGKLRQGDVGEVDVRTAAQHHKKLILHKEDPDDRRFWLVTGYNGKYLVHGWILGRDGKREEWWSDPTGKGRWAFFVPQKALNF